MSTSITWHGEDAYSGYEFGDANDGRTIDIAPGETVEVSDEKAAQLLADFPHLCALEGGQPDAGPRSLGEWSKAELDEYAAEHEVPDYPSGRRAKVAEKVAAIEAFQAAGAAAEEDDDEEPEL